MRRTLSLLSCLAALLLLGVAARADTIGPATGCASCLGNTFTLTFTQLTTNQFQITLTVDTSGFNGQSAGATARLNAVDFKVATENNFTIVSSTPPTGYSGAVKSNLNVAGANCTGQATSGFICFSSTTTNGGVSLPNGTLTFVAVIQLTDPTQLFTGSNAASIQALYLRTGPQGQIQGQLTSENITLQQPIPEPASMLLFGSGLLGIGALLRRRLAK